MLKKKLQNIPLGVKAAVVYTMASVFSRGLSMITVPIFTRIMSTSEIGMVNLYNSWYSLLNVIATLSLTSGGFQAAMKDFEGERDQYSIVCFDININDGHCFRLYLFSHT